ncbi:hypothetical protein HaLaN_12596, partial [Haematococcus lacustris]
MRSPSSTAPPLITLQQLVDLFQSVSERTKTSGRMNAIERYQADITTFRLPKLDVTGSGAGSGISGNSATAPTVPCDPTTAPNSSLDAGCNASRHDNDRPSRVSTQGASGGPLGEGLLQTESSCWPMLADANAAER